MKIEEIIDIKSFSTFYYSECTKYDYKWSKFTDLIFKYEI